MVARACCQEFGWSRVLSGVRLVSRVCCQGFAWFCRCAFNGLDGRVGYRYQCSDRRRLRQAYRKVE